MFAEPCWDASEWNTNQKEERIIRFNIAIEMIEKIYSDLCKENPKYMSRDELYEFCYIIYQLRSIVELLKEKQSVSILNDEIINSLPDDVKYKINHLYAKIKGINEINCDISHKINTLRKEFNDNYEKKQELKKEIESYTSSYQKKLIP